jgi:Flp pilus assembly protein CpaB
MEPANGVKRNLVPLLGIAFVVALAASGIFYGVFVSQIKQASTKRTVPKIAVASHALDRGTVLKATDLKLSSWAGEPPPGAFLTVDEAKGKTIYNSMQENEPLTEARVSAEKATGGLGIGRGMRALSVRVFDSSGLIPFLRAGHHVDVQVVQNRSHPDAVLRTILQNVEVLSVQAPDPSQAQAVPAVVTLLASPENADRVALADSCANIRLLLRNPLDNEEGTRPGMAVAALFKEGRYTPAPEVVHALAAQTPPGVKPVERAADATPEEMVDFLVQVAGASPSTLEEVHAALPGSQSPVSIYVSPLPAGEPGDRLRKSLQQQVDVLSSSRVRGSFLKPAYVQTGKRWQSGQGDICGFSLRLNPRSIAAGSLRVRLQPEVTVPSGRSSVSTRRVVVDLDLADGQSAIVTGLSEPGRTPTLLAELFADQALRAGNREAIVIVTPYLAPAAHNAVARNAAP